MTRQEKKNQERKWTRRIKKEETQDSNQMKRERMKISTDEKLEKRIAGRDSMLRDLILLFSLIKTKFIVGGKTTKKLKKD